MNTQIYKSQFEIKSISANGFFSGYASVFNKKDNHNDVIIRGAFMEAISSKDLSKIKLLWQHKQDEPIGQITAIKEDQYGLYIEGQLLLDIQKGNEVYALIKNEIITGLSIGYTVKDFELDNNSGTRILKSLNLIEISLVTFPAQEAAGVISVKSDISGIRDFEKFLREAGFSRSEAKMISNHGFKSSNNNQCDADSGKFKQLSTALDKAARVINTP